MSGPDNNAVGTPTRRQDKSDPSELVNDEVISAVVASPTQEQNNNETMRDVVASTPPPIDKLSIKTESETTGTGSTQSEPLTPLASPFPLDSPLRTDQVVSWAMTLQSPTLHSFSPSVVSNKTAISYHGTGLLLCINRSQQVNKTTRRCGVVLQEVANLYDQYGLALNKAGQMLPNPTVGSNAASSAAGLTDPVPLVALQQSMGTWAKDKNKVSRHIRSAISVLMQNYLSTHQDTLNAIQQRYAQCRSTCAYSRRRALSSYKKYTKALKDSEQLIEESEKNNPAGDEENSVVDEPQSAVEPPQTTNTAAKFSKRAEAKLEETLKRFRQYENRYKSRVKWENDCVATCQRLESMGLDTVQQMEEDRLTILVTTIIKVLSAQKHALDAGIISLSTDAAVESSQSDGQVEGGVPGKKSARKFVKMLKESKNSFMGDEETSGVMDAETLGLSEEIGLLRDGVRARLVRRRERILMAKTMSLFFESVIKASTKLGQSLRDLLKKESPNVSETLPVAMGAASEGAHVLRMWDGLTSFLEAEADGCFAMADSLRNLRAAKLDNVILYGEKSMKATGESDDFAWKNLCEAARAQGKAENRYRQSSVESARARDRVASLDGGSGGAIPGGQQQTEDEKETKEKMFTGKRVQKGLASIASLLPNASDHASKMLGPEARASVAQKVLKDAHEKESKEKQQLEAAVQATAAALTSYKYDAENAISRYDEEEKDGWQDIQSSFSSFADLCGKLLGSLQLDSISDLKPVFAKTRFGMVTDINEWRMKAQQELVAICVDSNVGDDSADSGFSLQLMLHSSPIVDKYMESTNVAEEAAEKADENEDVSDDELEDDEAEEPSPPENAEDAEPEEPSKALFKRPMFPPGAQFGVRGKRQQKRSKDQLAADHEDPETDLFLTYFWPDPVDPKTVPTIVNSFPCSFRDGAQPLPTQYGRIYLSASRAIFVSWSRKKLNLKWEEVNEIKMAKSFEDHADSALQIICKPKGASEDSCMMLDSFMRRPEAFDVMLDLREKALKAAAAPPPTEETGDPDGPVAPDPVMAKMHKVLSKHLRNISISKFHEIVWSETKPLLKPWLEKEAFDVEVEQWRDSTTVGPWCKETYQFERKTTFKVRRKTHLYIGPPIANVNQVHRCRLVGNDKCIVAMTIDFDGIPFSDTFAVEVRWVASREGASDLKVECGLFVDFKKKTYLKSKIQAGTIEESTPIYRNFFQEIKAACVAAGGTQAPDEVDEVEVVKPQKSAFDSVVDFFQENPQYIHWVAVVLGLSMMLLWRFGRRPPAESADLQLVLQRVDALEAKLDTMLELIQAIKDSK